jgi:4-amino-4-deoxy-L-arabinose transferase-like glycosyltransferase
VRTPLNLRSLSQHPTAAPLLLVALVNVAGFFLFPRVADIVGAELGTDGYKEIAENLLRGHGFVFSQGMRSIIELGYMKREPVYPLFLALILLLTGTLSPLALCFFQTCLSLASCYLVYRLGENIFGDSTGRAASFIYAVHPVSFWYSTQFASEVVTVPAVLGSLLAAAKLFEEPSRLKAAQVGLSIGIAVLARSACVALLPVVLVFAWLRWRTRPYPRLSYMAILICCYATVHSLWIARNYAVSQEFVPFTTNSGGIFFYGNEIVKRFDMKTQLAEETEAAVAAQSLYRSVHDDISARLPEISLARLEAKTDKQLASMARRFVLEEPLFVLRKASFGLYSIWVLSSTTAKTAGWIVFQVPLLVLALAGVWRHDWWNSNQCYLCCVVIAYIVPYTLLLALARYSMPITPIVILFASYGLVGLYGRRSSVSIPRSVVA